ncbi:MAG: efflux transporter outer membrane subunit [Chitinophagaceae bacterium]|nr:efflux transporter outer membrane subunit [Chitinophagaceae bacterium]
MIHRLNRKSYTILLLLIVFLSACRLGKEYQRPQLELPKQFNAISFSDTSSIADIEWKKFFTNTELQGLIEKGISYNHDLLIAIKRIDIARLQVNQSKALALPQVDLLLIGQISRPSNNSLNGISLKNFIGKSYVENYSAGVNLSWEADIWGKIRAQKEIALTEYLRTTEAAKAVQTQLVADIAQGFFNLLMLDKQLDIARKNLLLSDSFVVATRLLKDAGIGNALGVQQAESQKQATALLIPQLEQSIALQENALQVLTGQLPGSITRGTSLNEFSIAADLSTGLPLAMVSRRPDVRSAELTLISANAEIGIAQANMYPALSITAGGGLESFKSSNWFNIPSSLFGLAAGSIAQPIFRRRELRTRFEIAKIEREQSVIQFRQSTLQAVGEVSDALVQVQKLESQEQIAEAQVDTLKRAVFNAQLLFKSDMANYLEVITAQSNSLEVELGLADIRRQQLNAMVELYRSLGGGWK